MQIYLARDGQRVGPFTLEEVRARLASGAALAGDLAWYEGAANWVPVHQVPGLNLPPPISQTQPPSLPSQGSGGTGGTGGTFGTGAPAGPPLETFAIVSLILGILGLVALPLIPSIPGAIFGHLGLGRIKRSAGALGGRGLALAGTITSYVGIAIWTLVAVLMAVFFLFAMREMERPREVEPSGTQLFNDPAEISGDEPDVAPAPGNPAENGR